MSPSSLRRYIILFALLLPIVFAVVRWRQASPPVDGPRAESLPTAAVSAEAPATAPAPALELVRTEELERMLAAATAARRTAEAEAQALRAQLAPMEGKVVVSLGKVEEIGKRTATVLGALQELRALGRRDRATLSPEENRRLLDLQRQHADVLGMLPEIAGFQNSPDEYGKFFRSMVQEAAGLSDAQANEVQTYMEQRGVLMNRMGLNAAREPKDPAQEALWEERRDEFNEATANGLRALLPPAAADRAGITPELMELLEMDFDKAGDHPAVK